MAGTLAIGAQSGSATGRRGMSNVLTVPFVSAYNVKVEGCMEYVAICRVICVEGPSHTYTCRVRMFWTGASFPLYIFDRTSATDYLGLGISRCTCVHMLATQPQNPPLRA